jgi:hypothetical protein
MVNKRKRLDKKTMGKTSRAAGKAFELKVRHDLESKGWIVCKWSNNVEFGQGSVVIDLSTQDTEKGILGKAMCNSGKLIPAKHTFNPFTKAMSAGNGFPDFVVMMPEDIEDNKLIYPRMLGGFTKPNTQGEIPLEFFKANWIVFLVESKMNGKLDKIEKEKIEWLKMNLHIKIYVASKEKRGEIKYELK